MVAVLLLLAWLPASTHCLLAAALQNATLSGCCLESEQSQGGHTHHNSDCCPFCDTFETGKYLAFSKDQQQVSSGAGELLPLIAAIQWVQYSNPAPAFIPHESPTDAVSWQFETRSARLGRSPNVSF
ncbi:MAG: hypothetical protein QF721_08105 [Verrucomicrobiota bacterium]|jgi:hypothetical protein|nr:hypothetical protein [Verrucomicrobiota bacterium]